MKKRKKGEEKDASCAPNLTQPTLSFGRKKKGRDETAKKGRGGVSVTISAMIFSPSCPKKKERGSRKERGVSKQAPHPDHFLSIGKRGGKKKRKKEKKRASSSSYLMKRKEKRGRGRELLFQSSFQPRGEKGGRGKKGKGAANVVVMKHGEKKKRRKRGEGTVRRLSERKRKKKREEKKGKGCCRRRDGLPPRTKKGKEKEKKKKGKREGEGKTTWSSFSSHS